MKKIGNKATYEELGKIHRNEGRSDDIQQGTKQASIKMDGGRKP